MRLKPGESDTYTFQGSKLMGWVQWGKTYDPALDMAVEVTSPNGTVLRYDDSHNAKQLFYGTDEDGTHVIKVTNTGQKAVKYSIEYAAS